MGTCCNKNPANEDVNQEVVEMHKAISTQNYITQDDELENTYKEISHKLFSFDEKVNVKPSLTIIV